MENKYYNMCKKNCCPKLYDLKKNITIVDDNENSVILTKKQFKEFIEKVKSGDFDQIIKE